MKGTITYELSNFPYHQIGFGSFDAFFDSPELF